MKNFLSKHYDHYYIQTEDGQTVETTRGECIAPGEKPTMDNPYKQRWHSDIEAGYIVRLLRNEKGEKLYRVNTSSLKREERYQSHKYACVSKGTSLCDNDCDNCTKKRVAQTIDLDKPLYTDESNNDVYLEIAVNPFDEMFEREEKKERAKKVFEEIFKLPKEQQKVITLYIKGKTQAEIAKIMGKNQSCVSRQIQTAIKNLKKIFS